MSDTTNKVIAVARIGLGLVAGYLTYTTIKAMMAQQRGGPDLSRSSKSYSGTNKLLTYITEKTVKLHPVQEKLKEVTLKHKWAIMLGAPEQLQFLAQLVKLIGGKKTLDIGAFTGYSALSIALALPKDGRLICCDISEEYTNIGKPYWKEAGVDTIIELNIRPAAETLQHLLDIGEAGTFDFAFIDADKTGYATYYELCLKLLRPGGIIALDNLHWGGKVTDPAVKDKDTQALRDICQKATNDPRLLWSGKVTDPAVKDKDTQALRDICQKAANDPRVDFSLLNVGDGTGIAIKL